MPLRDRDRDNEAADLPDEKRHRQRKEKDPNRPHRTKKERKIDPETGEVIRSHRPRRDKEKDKDQDKETEKEGSSSMADVVSELARTGSAPGIFSRTSLPYPSFSKAHSKEAVNSREDVGISVKGPADLYTPDPTDLGANKPRSKSAEDLRRRDSIRQDGRPPSPPETEFSEQKFSGTSRKANTKKDEEDVEVEARSGPRRSKSGRGKEDASVMSGKSKGSKASTAIKSPTFKGEDRQPSNNTTARLSPRKGSGSDSNATSVAPNRSPLEEMKNRPTVLDTDSSPASVQDPSPQTPTQTTQLPPRTGAKPIPSSFPYFEPPSPEVVSDANDSPQPPPPPPPPSLPQRVPRVDYLLQNGGLPRPVQKKLLTANAGVPSQQTGMRSYATIHSELDKIFGTFTNVLEQYETVINKHGSLAVATGYRSVARRLLDRLEGVFARDLSSEGCLCIICRDSNLSTYEGSKGLTWGEVLEWTSGRRELPTWPAFDFASLGVNSGLGISVSPEDPSRPGSPIKIDPDVGEEFREHYLAQSKKTKNAVNKWLSSCPQTASAPPQDVDEDTLSFAIITHLDQQDRSIFNALISGSSTPVPIAKAPTPMRKPRTDFMIKTVQSIQRLYRLPIPPKDAEVALYLLKYPHLHGLLTTLSNIKPSEWEILTSGRFDGFLWSGADGDQPPSSSISRGPTPVSGNPLRAASRGSNPSRTTTPFSPPYAPTMSPISSRGLTPHQTRHPISIDEETEIAVLAEVEREIYIGMEALEDAFEGLHRKAEAVRRALRERGAGLSMSLESRRTQPYILSSTPAPPNTGSSGNSFPGNWERDSETANNSEGEWDVGEELGELAPDDSASNISSSRHRRPKRRTERRTPAPVEEEEDED